MLAREQASDGRQAAYPPGLLWQVRFDLRLNFVRLCPFSDKINSFSDNAPIAFADRAACAVLVA